jgi:nucleoid DNA-binding protein
MKAKQHEDIECNARLIREVAEEQDVTISQVEDILKHVARYTADVIRSGNLEGVMIPYLGKFQVKIKNQQYKDYYHALGKDMKGYLRNNPEALKIIFDGDKETDEDEVKN